MNIKKFVIALLIWFIGLPLSIAISYFSRLTGNFNSLGMPESVWYMMHLSIFILSIIFLYGSVKTLSFLKKLGGVIIVTFFYAAYYLAITWFYIIESGVDSV